LEIQGQLRCAILIHLLVSSKQDVVLAKTGGTKYKIGQQQLICANLAALFLRQIQLAI